MKPVMLGTMQDFPLTVTMLFRHGARLHPESLVTTFEGDYSRRTSFRDTADRATRLAGALRALGVGAGERVGTFCWNTQEHLEAYLAVPSSGAVLHTLNVRLFADQLAYIVNHAADRLIIVDSSLLPLLAPVAAKVDTVRHYVVVGNGDWSALAEAAPSAELLRYDELLAGASDEFAWPNLDERGAASMCYTSGTTGDPKGVVYSQRSTFLHALALGSASCIDVEERDRVMPVVPMFHANAWGFPYAAWLAGADLVMPNHFLQAEPLGRLITEERPTITGAVPTIWSDLLRHADMHPEVNLSSLRLVLCGGAAVPRSLIEAFQERHQVRVVQAWGMTETSPVAAVAHPPKDVELGSPEDLYCRARTGRAVPGVELRIVGDDGPVPWDDETMGEIEVRGPWITGSYYSDNSGEKFHDGWLRTGDIGTIDKRGFVRIADRAKDVIKSGGEWISSVELENHLMAHPGVAEAAVIGVPDPRWDERPLACVVLNDGAQVAPGELAAFLKDRMAAWQVPARWSFLSDIPKTSVGKFDKKLLRARHEAGALNVLSAD